jgi:hypothetical protein
MLSPKSNNREKWGGVFRHYPCYALMKGVSRREFDMVLAWSVDRLGRSLTGLHIT